MSIKRLSIIMIVIGFMFLYVKQAFAFDLPEYKSTTLYTGANVYSIQTTELPMIHFRITFDVGTNHEPAGCEGTIDVLKDWMDDGTTDLDRQALASKINALGIKLSFKSDFEKITFTMNTLSKFQTEALDLWLKYLFQSKLGDQHYNEIRTRVVDNTKANLVDGNNLLKSRFYNVMFGSGSYHTNGPSRPEIIAKIPAEKVRSFYNDYIGLTNTRVVVIGDFNESLFEQLNNFTKSINKPNKLAPEMNENILPEPIPGIYLIDRPFSQGFIRIGNRAIPRRDKDYYKYQLVNVVLGGTPNSALLNRIRRQEGLVYYVYSATPAWDNSGVWLLSFATKLEKVPIGIKTAVDTISDLQKTGISKEEFEFAQKFNMKSMQFNITTYESIASYIDSFEEIGIGQKGFSYTEARYKEATIDDLNIVLRRVINPDKFIIMVVGPKDKLWEPLSKMGKVTLID